MQRTQVFWKYWRMDGPDGDMARWSVAQFDAWQRVLDAFGRLPLPDGDLADWGRDTVAWAELAAVALAEARAGLARPVPALLPKDVEDAATALRAGTAQVLDLLDAFSATMTDAAHDLAEGRADDIGARAERALDGFPWLLLEATRMRFAAAAQCMSDGDVARWLLLARAHAYAVRRDLEDLEPQVTFGVLIQADASSLPSTLSAMDDAVAAGHALVATGLQDSDGIGGDLLRSYATSFDTLAALSAAWSPLRTAFADTAGRDLARIVEMACAAFSRADADIDRQQARRAEHLRGMG